METDKNSPEDVKEKECKVNLDTFKHSEEPVPEKEEENRITHAETEKIIEKYVGKKKVEKVKILLKEIVDKKIEKQEVAKRLEILDIDYLSYNSIVLKIISAAMAEGIKKPVREQKETGSKILRIKGVLKELFLLEIKKEMEDPAYTTKTQQQYSFYKRTPEDLSSVVSTRPHLISLFSANYNVLCCKIKKILSIKDLHNRLKKGSFEYKLNEQLSVDIAKCAYVALIHYIKEMIGKCLNMNGQLDRDILIRTMFGNVRGVYLLYNSYPPSPQHQEEL